MRFVALLVAFLFAAAADVAAQTQRQGGTEQKADNIKPEVKAWRLTADYFEADTIPLDTLLDQHQINNPIFKKGLMSVTLGNLGSPSASVFYPQMRQHEGNLFFNALIDYIPSPQNLTFYNTRTPFTRLSYQMGMPKRRSEEMVDVIFTQNINKRVNAGFEYMLLTSVGKYDSQMTEHSRFRMWTSADGDYYRGYFNIQYNRSEIAESGGIRNEDFVLYPDSFSYEKPEDIPVFFTNMSNNRSVYSALCSHSLDLGHIERYDADSVFLDEIAPLNAHHTLTFQQAADGFHVKDVRMYADMPDLWVNTLHTHPSYTYDCRKYLEVRNQLALTMTEEFNRLLRFGLRGYVGVDVRQYRHDAVATEEPDPDKPDEPDATVLVPHRTKESRVTSYFGGQIFKKRGDHLRLDAGMRFYFAGYKAADIELGGNIEFVFGRDSLRKSSLYAKARLELASPQYYEEDYESQHFVWHQHLDRKKRLYVEGGLRIPSHDFSVYLFAASLNSWTYFNGECRPAQKSGITQVLGLYAQKHFEAAGFNAMIRLGAQSTSDADVMPLPSFLTQSTFFYERLLFGVLRMQFGCDVRYNTRYAAPCYNPALMQFYAGGAREVGNYGYFDPFVNFHLGKICAYLKFEHINSLWGSNDYFHTAGYPANPNTFKYGISWNFYD